MSPSANNAAGETPAQEGKKSGWDLKRIVIVSAASLIGVIAAIFIIGLLLAANNVEATAVIIRMLRDMMIIFLALEGILVILALSILILQVAHLINVLQNEVQPILENTQDTVETANTTVKFVTKNITSPFISASAFAAGVSSVARDMFGIRRAIRYSREDDASMDEDHGE